MSKTLKWLLGILIALILISLGFWGGKLYFDKKNEKETSSSTPATTESTTKDNTATEEQAQNGAGWKIFKNLASGEWLEYGISVNEKNDPAMTKAQAKDIVHKIIASFSPAE